MILCKLKQFISSKSNLDVLILILLVYHHDLVIGYDMVTMRSHCDFLTTVIVIKDSHFAMLHHVHTIQIPAFLGSNIPNA